MKKPQKSVFSIRHEGLNTNSYFKSLLEHSHKQNIWKPVCDVLLRACEVLQNKIDLTMISESDYYLKVVK